jgi:hypothetical protein
LENLEGPSLLEHLCCATIFIFPLSLFLPPIISIFQLFDSELFIFGLLIAIFELMVFTFQHWQDRVFEFSQQEMDLDFLVLEQGFFYHIFKHSSLDDLLKHYYFKVSVFI